MIRICLKGVLKYRIFVLFPLIMTVFLLNILAQGENTKESAAAVIKKVFMESGSEAAKMKFKEMHIGEEGKYYFNEQEFINLGNSLRSSGRVKAAITAFKMTIELFPESSNAWFRLGRAFVRDVNREKAVECYKKALELDSKNAMAKEEMGWIDFRIDDARLETREIERFEPGVKTGLRGPYLGETPPGMKPKVFAPGIVSVYGSNENTITFSPDGKEIYFGKEAGINMCKLTDEGWTAPIKTAIPGYEMQISPSTGKMYYTGGGIWEMERTASGWSKPRKLVDMGMFATVTQDEILYTTVFSQGGKIGRYVKADGKYSNYEILGDQINIATFNAHPYISPDKSFLIFDSNKPGRGGNVNLYISFRKTDGSWSNAIYLGDEINAPGTNNCPSFSPDGKYFFYTSHNDIYWISAEYLKKFKPKKTVTNPLRYHRSNIFPLISSGPCQNSD